LQNFQIGDNTIEPRFQVWYIEIRFEVCPSLQISFNNARHHSPAIVMQMGTQDSANHSHLFSSCVTSTLTFWIQNHSHNRMPYNHCVIWRPELLPFVSYCAKMPNNGMLQTDQQTDDACWGTLVLSIGM